MLSETDIVVLIEDNDTLKKGSIGVILGIYKQDDEKEFLIEFEENIILSVKENQLDDIKIYNLKERIIKLKKI